VPRNYIANVGHATVTQLQGISVKYFMEKIVFREAIINYLEEFVSDIRFDIRVVRWIKQYNVSVSSAFNSLCLLGIVF
jgi:hypothetical protein